MPKKYKIFKTATLIVILFNTIQLNAQFYNGHQMTFGKNRVQYNDFLWQYYRFPKFDTYFYVDGQKIAEYVSEYAMHEIEYTEYMLEEILQRRIIFIVYNKLSEFRQSNIGLVSGNDEYNIGGVTRIIDNKVFLYYEGDHIKLNRQIKSAIAEVLFNEMLYGGNFRDRVSSSTLLNLPEWFGPGLISFMAYDTDPQTENFIKKGIVTKKYQKIHRLHGNDAKYAGHSFWRYLTETYGREIVTNIVYMTRITKNVEAGFLYVLGTPLKEILNDWFYYNESRYKNDIENRQSIDNETTFGKKTNKKTIYTQAKMSPNGQYIAYTSNRDGRYKIFLYNTITNKTKRVTARGHKLEQITDYSYPLIEWHPTGELLTSIYEHKGSIFMDMYHLETKEHTVRELFVVNKILDFAYSPNGQEIVMSAVDNGYTDIYLYSTVASTFTKLTNDIADDINPRYSAQTNKIVFASNRQTTQLDFQKNSPVKIQNNYDIFVYQTKKQNGQLERLTNSYHDNDYLPMAHKNDQYFYLTNKNGIINLAHAKFDSVINYIDTAVHYRVTTKQNLITNYPYNIEYYHYSPFRNEHTKIIQGSKRFTLFTQQINPALINNNNNPNDSWFKSYVIEKNTTDSIYRDMINRRYQRDTTNSLLFNLTDSLIDINNYVFDIEKSSYYFDNSGQSPVFKLPKQLVYFTNFYSNLLVTQVDFGFMNESYQAFTGSAFYFNPGFNVLTKIGAIDLFEDYKITGGIRFSIDFESNEYLLSVENLKTRLDKQYIYHRQVFESADNDYYAKIFTNELMARFKYPITQIHSFRATASLRLDQKIYKSIDQTSLNKPNETKLWTGIKGEYIFDNTRNIALNLLDGGRVKTFAEYHTKLGSGSNQHLFVVGTDARYYLPIHRDFILASRIAASTSFGNALLIYYLGGVDNWMNFSQTNPTFDNSTNINTEKNWVYQAVATNMRGFIQNVRNGNSFAVANIELRWPVVRYLFNRPINNDFLNNFMIVGFADAGSAWNGFNPANAVNAYDYQPIHTPPITVIIDRKRSPVVAGVGFGLRSRLLGYYIRTDWAWGIDGGRMLPRVFYLSLCTDF